MAKTAAASDTSEDEKLPAVQEQPTGGTSLTRDAAPDYMSGYLGAGMEEMSQEDQSIPFLSILQKMSPQCDETDGAFIEGAKPGMLFNTVTGNTYPRSNKLWLIPVYFKSAYVEWKPRESGGGIVATYQKDAEGERRMKQTTRSDKSKDITPEGNLFIDTHYHYVLVFDTETGEIFPALISMSATQLKKSRRWNSAKTSFYVMGQDGRKTPEPSFARGYTVTTSVDSNEHGSWFLWEINHAGRVTQDIFREAIEFYEAVKKGAVKTSDESATGGADGGSGKGKTVDDGMPM